jgi:hypothetical protein
VPRINRRNVPTGIFLHLLARVRERRIEPGSLEDLSRWLDGDPEVPDGPWYKLLPGMTVCGEGEWVKTFLLPGQVPHGKQVD